MASSIIASSVFLLALVQPSLVAGVERMQSGSESSAHVGLRGLAQNKYHASHATGPESEPLLKPQDNDTIPQSYWDMANRLIDSAGATTPMPISANLKLNGGGTPRPLTKIEKIKAVPQPYDTAIGASILNTLKETPTDTPPPTQDYVSQQFVAQCPMIMFSNELYIRAPKCGDSMGNWADPASNRDILRWQPSTGSNLDFGVDSRVNGNGSAIFAKAQEKATYDDNVFQLTNCLGVTRYTIEERLTRVNKMGHGRTTMTMHDVSRGSEAFFLEYLIRAPNGTIVAHTGFDRLNQNVVNITLVDTDAAGASKQGGLLATARREGKWTNDGWNQCTTLPREWRLQFWLNQHDFHQVATVMDLRVAAAATFTLMAYRDQFREASTGFVRISGSPHMLQMLWQYFGTWVVFALFIACVVGGCCALQISFGDRLRRTCFRLEAFLLPKKAAKQRRPKFNPVW